MTIVITGASRGIGASLAELYRAEGKRVIGTSRRGVEAPDHVPLDVGDASAFGTLAHHLDGVSVDLLICNAGVYPDKGQSLADGYPPEMWADVFAVNVAGVFLTVQTILPNLQMSSQPKIAIISSQMASHTRATGGSYIYRASKAAALNLGRNLATDLAHIGIAVGIYHPGWVKTDMGGEAADITVDVSANGLKERFDALSLTTTGCFETWDGRTHTY